MAGKSFKLPKTSQILGSILVSYIVVRGLEALGDPVAALGLILAATVTFGLLVAVQWLRNSQ